MSVFVCPICRKPLTNEDGTMRCAQGHCYDIAKQGYVNLLLSQQSSSKRHGDDRLMVRSRRDFLNKGYYACLADALCKAASSYAFDSMKAVDAGCGECWYTAQILEAIENDGIRAAVAGIDISKDALIYASKRSDKIERAVAGVFDMPVADGGCDMLFNVFAPLACEEFLRVLSVGGVLIRAVPLEKHLLGFKEHIYGNVYENKVESFELEGFRLVQKKEIRKLLRLESKEDILNLFRMTPYYYKTSAADQAKIEALDSLETQIEFGVLVYIKD